MVRGIFGVLEGTDGSGKGTHTDLLIERLRREGYQVEKADFPQYGSWSAQFVERYLRGEFGTAKEVSAKKASLFYALDRFAAAPQINRWLEEGKIVISNRYTSANKGHQLGKINDPGEMNHFLSWLNELEYQILGIPVPDITLFLHMKPEIGQRLVDQKAQREYIHGAKRDIHEKDLDHLRNAERAFLYCLDHDRSENWKKITCFEQDKPRTIEVIHEEVYQALLPLLKK
jgi:dTMP kinase